MNKIYKLSFVFLLGLILSSISYAQNKANTPKTFKQEMAEVEVGFYKSEAIKKIGTALTRGALDKSNREAASKATQQLWKYSKDMSKDQMEKFLARLSKMSTAGINQLKEMSPRQLNSFVAGAAGKLSKNAGVLKQIIAGAGDKAGNMALQTISQVDDIIANNGKVPKALYTKLKDAASKLPPEKAKAYLDLLKKKFSSDWVDVVNLEDASKGPASLVGTVVDGVFVLNDAYDIYYSDDEPEIKGIKATGKMVDYGISTGAGVATTALGAGELALGAGLGVGLTIAFTANRVSTLYTEIAMLQKEREAAKNAEENEKIDNAILVRRQFVNISNKIKSGQVSNAKFLLIKLEKFMLNNRIDNLEKLYDLHSELEEKANKAERNELINEIINEARRPYTKALNFYRKGVELNEAKIFASEALTILNNNLKNYPEINGLTAISKAEQLITAIEEKIANATDLFITETNLPERVYTGQFLEIKVFVSGGIPYYRAIGSILGNISDDEVVTMYWEAPSEPGVEHLTFSVRDCMGRIANVSESIEVVEGEVEKEEIVIEEFDGNSRLDGLWEIHPNSEVIKTTSNAENNKATYQVTKFSALDKSTKSIWGDEINIAKVFVLKFFSSKKIYFQKIENLEHGFSYFYLYKYDEDTFEQIVLREIDDSHFEIFPINAYAGGSNFRLLLSVKGSYMECTVEDGNSSSMTSYKYKFSRRNTPRRPPTLSNGAWSWNDLEDDFKDELAIYSDLSSTEKNNFNLSKIEEDEDAYQTLQWKIALYKKYQSQYTDLLASYKGKIPSTIKKEDIIWALVDVKLTNLGPSLPYSLTSSVSEGWVRIWKERVAAEHGENYIAPNDSEDDPNDKRTITKVAEFIWDLPEKQYQLKQKWNTNFQRSGSLKADLQTLDDGAVVKDNFIEFHSDKNSKEVTLECKYYYTIQGDYEMYDEFRIVFKFESGIK